MADLDLHRFRRSLEDALKRFPEAEFLKDVRLLLDSYERLVAERKAAERHPLHEPIRKVLEDWSR